MGPGRERRPQGRAPCPFPRRFCTRSRRRGRLLRARRGSATISSASRSTFVAGGLSGRGPGRVSIASLTRIPLCEMCERLPTAEGPVLLGSGCAGSDWFRSLGGFGCVRPGQIFDVLRSLLRRRLLARSQGGVGPETPRSSSGGGRGTPDDFWRLKKQSGAAQEQLRAAQEDVSFAETWRERSGRLAILLQRRRRAVRPRRRAAATA